MEGEGTFWWERVNRLYGEGRKCSIGVRSVGSVKGHDSGRSRRSKRGNESGVGSGMGKGIDRGMEKWQWKWKWR